MKPLSIFLAITLAGCASLPPSEIAETHPANPEALADGYPPPKPMLMTATNLVSTNAEPATAEPPHEHK